VNEEIKQKGMLFDRKEDYIWLFDHCLSVPEFVDGISVRNTRNDANCVDAAMEYYKFLDARMAKVFSMTFDKQVIADGRQDANEIKYSRQDKRKIVDDASRVLRAAERIFDDDDATKKFYGDLRLMVASSFVDLDIMHLSMVEGLGSTRLGRLIEAGIHSPQQFIDTKPTRLKEVLGRVSLATVGTMLYSAMQIRGGEMAIDEPDARAYLE